MSTLKKLQSLAEEFLDREGPLTMQDIVADPIPPDPMRDEFLNEALEAIFLAQDLESAEAELEPYPYDWGVMQWVSSNLNRLQYVNEALRSYSSDIDIMEVLRHAQVLEQTEVFHLTLNYLERLLEGREVSPW